MATYNETLSEIKEVKIGKTTYTLTKGKPGWFLFNRVVQMQALEFSNREDISININTYEVYCNRTGKQTFGVRRYLDLVLRIEKIFGVSSLRDF